MYVEEMMGFPLMCFNRTFMELKLYSDMASKQGQYCFNRTFMELKSIKAVVRSFQLTVLIVPLWN